MVYPADFYRKIKEVVDMKIKKMDIEKNKPDEEKVLDALELYKDFEEKLGMYNTITGKSNIDIGQTIDPASYLKKQLKGKGIRKPSEIKQYLGEFKKFIQVIQKTERENPYMDLTDITSRKNRMKIGEIIGELNPDEDFVPANLDAVTIIECYGLYEAINDIQENQSSERSNKAILESNGVTEEMYTKSKRRMQTYESMNRREIYDRIRRSNSEDIVHIVAATLEMSPGEAEKDLKMFHRIHNKDTTTNEFEQSLKVDSDYVEENPYLGQLTKWEECIDSIMHNENITDHEKSLLVKEYREKIERTCKIIEDNKNKNSEKDKIKKDKVTNFVVRGGDVKRLSSNTLKRNGINLGPDDREIG